MTPLQRLIAEVREGLDEEGIFLLYEFSWTLRGYDAELGESQIEAICLQAYADIRARRAVTLVWVDWPVDPDRARPAEPSTPPDFDIHSTGTPPQPMLALIPAHSG